jgi:type II secretory pathway pseudopilin PulG
MDSNDEEGFGLLEIVISMLMLAVLALGLLPLLIQGVKQAASNATMATATQLVDGALDTAGRQTACSLLTTGSTTTSDSRGVALTLVKTRATCPTTFPATVAYSVTVTRNDTGATVASAKTLIYVTAS